MNRGEIRSAVIQALNESATPVHWTVAEIDRYIDDWYRETAEYTDAVVATVTLTCPPGEFFIPLPDNVLAPFAARDVASGLPIDPVDFFTYIDQKLDRTWRRDSGTSRPSVFAAWGLTHILIFPPFASGGQIEVECSTVESLTTDGAAPAIPPQFHPGAIDYAIGECLLKGADQERMGRSRRKYKEWSDATVGLEQWGVSRNAGTMAAIYGESFHTAAGT